jgi:hypothetical protein
MALLRLLLDLQQQWPLQLVVAHCNHCMRPDAAANAVFVRQQVQQLGLEYCEASADWQLRSEVCVLVLTRLFQGVCCSSHSTCIAVGCVSGKHLSSGQSMGLFLMNSRACNCSKVYPACRSSAAADTQMICCVVVFMNFHVFAE